MKTKMEWAQDAYEVIKPVFDAGKTITYGELAETIGYPYAVWHGHFGDCLAMVMLEDPMLAAAVVRKDTGKPSPKFYAWAARVGRKVA